MSVCGERADCLLLLGLLPSMAARRLLARALSSSASPPTPPQLLSLADLTVPQLGTLLASAAAFKQTFKAHPVPLDAQKYGLPAERDALKGRTVALVFSKRSTRTRVASESATALLGKCPRPEWITDKSASS